MNIFESIVKAFNAIVKSIEAPKGFRDVISIDLCPAEKFDSDFAKMDCEVKTTRLGESKLSRWLVAHNMDIPMLISVGFDFRKEPLKKAQDGLKRNPSCPALKDDSENLIYWWYRCVNTVRLNEILTNGLDLGGVHYELIWQSSGQAKKNEVSLIRSDYKELVDDFISLGLTMKEKIGKYLVRKTLATSNGKEIDKALPKMVSYIDDDTVNPENCVIIKDKFWKVAPTRVVHVHDCIEEEEVTSWKQNVTDGGAIMLLDNTGWSDEKLAQYYKDASKGLVGAFSGRIYAAGKNGVIVMLRSGANKILAAHGLDPETATFKDAWGDERKVSDTTILMGTSGWKYSGYDLKNWDDAVFRMSVREQDDINVCVVPHLRKLDLSYQANQYLYFDEVMTEMTVTRSVDRLNAYQTDKGIRKLVMPEMREAVKEFPATLSDPFVQRMIEAAYDRSLVKHLTTVPAVAQMRELVMDSESIFELALGVEPTVRIKKGQCIVPGAPVGYVAVCRYPVSGATWDILYNIGVPEGMEDIYATGYCIFISIEGDDSMRLQADYDGDKFIVITPDDDYNKAVIDYLRELYKIHEEDGKSIGLTCLFDIESDKRPYSDELFIEKMMNSQSSKVGYASDGQALYNLNAGEQYYLLQKDITAEVDMGKGAAPDCDTLLAQEIAAQLFREFKLPEHVQLSKKKEKMNEFLQDKQNIFNPEGFPESWAERYAYEVAERANLNFDWEKITTREWVQFKPGEKATRTPSWKMYCCGDIKKLSLYTTAKAAASGNGLLNFEGSVFGRKVTAIKRAETRMAEGDLKYKVVDLVEEEVEAARNELFKIADERGVSHDAVINSLVMEIYQSGDSDAVKDQSKRILWKCFWREMTDNIRNNKRVGKYPDIIVPEDIVGEVEVPEEQAEWFANFNVDGLSIPEEDYEDFTGEDYYFEM